MQWYADKEDSRSIIDFLYFRMKIETNHCELSHRNMDSNSQQIQHFIFLVKTLTIMNKK
jgi:hypothetical protein